MFLSLPQIQQSLSNLPSINPFFGMSFLAFKKSGLSVGNTERVVFSRIADDILFKHYRPCTSYSGFYNPFLTSDKDDRWLARRYGSTSLQRITTDTFSDALLHEKKTQFWGWQPNYIEILQRHLNGERIPAFDLAVWLFREDIWLGDISREVVRDRLFKKFSITQDEIESLFDTSLPNVPENWLQEEPVSEHELLNIIGYPENSAPEQGAALHLLELFEIGPASYFRYEPAARLNIITGDNSLGKTFLFECIWWALTGEWSQGPIHPRANVSKKTPRISFSLAGSGGRVQQFKSDYDWNKRQWELPKSRSAEAGVVLYARFDGSFAVWDSTRRDFEGERDTPTQLVFTRDALWEGLRTSDGKGWLCNGLIRDWVSWQLSGERYENRWRALLACLKSLSPSGESMTPGDPVRVSITDEREVPTLYMPYGLVPIVNASAGVQRAIALAYVLVWTWFRHTENSELLRRDPQNRVVLIVDEVEAHLHPRWQRVIIPALMATVKELSSSLRPQIHVATHSPMVMASTEVVFDEEQDDFHHLRLDGNEVILEELLFVKRGRADLWLMSDAFGLEMPRSVPGEDAIRDAKKLQLLESPSPKQVKEVHERLVRVLAQDDDFWPRWRFFAKQHGVEV